MCYLEMFYVSASIFIGVLAAIALVVMLIVATFSAVCQRRFPLRPARWFAMPLFSGIGSTPGILLLLQQSSGNCGSVMIPLGALTGVIGGMLMAFRSIIGYAREVGVCR